MPTGASAYLEWLYRIARSLHYQGLHSQDILRTALSMTCAAIDVTHACILTFDEHGELQEAYTLGAEDEQELWNNLLTQGLISVVQYGQRTVNIRNVSTDPRWPHPPGMWEGSAVGIPLMRHSNLSGALLLLQPAALHAEVDLSSWDGKRAQIEIMNLYREKGANPFTGCFPLLIQLPFLIGMFDLLKSTFELRGASFIPGWIDMPSGSVTRRIFLGSFSGSIRTAATTGCPDSTRPSLPVKQTCLGLLGSWPLRQNLVQGE